MQKRTPEPVQENQRRLPEGGNKYPDPIVKNMEY